MYILLIKTAEPHQSVPGCVVSLMKGIASLARHGASKSKAVCLILMILKKQRGYLRLTATPFLLSLRLASGHSLSSQPQF